MEIWFATVGDWAPLNMANCRIRKKNNVKVDELQDHVYLRFLKTETLRKSDIRYDKVTVMLIIWFSINGDWSPSSMTSWRKRNLTNVKVDDKQDSRLGAYTDRDFEELHICIRQDYCNSNSMICNCCGVWLSPSWGNTELPTIQRDNFKQDTRSVLIIYASTIEVNDFANELCTAKISEVKGSEYIRGSKEERKYSLQRK